MFSKPLLMSEGSSDRTLIPILRWLLRQHFPTANLEIEWADFRVAPKKLRTLDDKMGYVYAAYRFDLLFVHFDADNTSVYERGEQIQTRIRRHQKKNDAPHVPVIPVQTMETWLLLDEKAIVEAAGNSASNVSLDMPARNRLEQMPSRAAKDKLYNLLTTAHAPSGGGRRRQRYRPQQDVHRIPELMDDIGVLRVLPAFQALEAYLQQLAESSQ